MTDDVITLDVTWKDILRQMLSCFGLRINCQSYKAFFKNMPQRILGDFL